MKKKKKKITCLYKKNQDLKLWYSFGSLIVLYVSVKKFKVPCLESMVC